MEKPRRRAAGRPAGPPNPRVDEAVPPAAATTVPPAGDAAPGGESADPGRRERSEQPVHRRRQRASKARSDGEPPARRRAADIDFADDRIAATAPAAREDRRRGESAVERSLRALVSLRSTQLTPTVAMRAREVAAPSAADLAAAEEEVVLVRRYYVPPAPLTTPKKGEGAGETRSSEPRSRADSRRAGRKPPPASSATR